MPEAPKRRRNIHPLRDALLAGVCTFVISAVGLAIIYLKSRDAQFDAVRTEMLQLARTMATQVDGDLHEKLVADPRANSAEHRRLLEPLVRMHRATRDVWFVYTGVYQNGRIHWVLDTATEYRIPGNDAPADELMELYEEHDPVYERAFREGLDFADTEPSLEGGHYYLSAAAPIRNRAGKVVGMLGLDMVLDALDARMADVRRALFIALAVVTLLSIGAGAVAHTLRRFALAIVMKMRRARAEAERNAARAEAANRAKATFLAMMSHEIRTPMNGMLGVADLLRNMSPDPSQKKLLDILSGSGESLLRIINDILDFSKIEAERLELRPKPFEVSGLLEELGTLLRTQAGSRHIEFVLDSDPELPVAVIGDRQRLSQVLLNLGNNAVKFTDRGEVRLVVRSGAAVDGKASLQFEMRDTGIGMSEAALSQLFAPFTQLTDAGHQRGGGTGLGLVIAQKLVKLMGGEIVVASLPGKGSSFGFSVSLPVTEMPAITGTHPVARPEGLGILVAEDNVVNQTIIQAMLAQLGHRVRVVANGREALRVLAQEHHDLVLMDCNMPVMDGLEATRLLRAGAGGVLDADIPVVALTANAMDGDRDACLAAGMNDFLAKPVNIATLRNAIESVRGVAASTAQRAAG